MDAVANMHLTNIDIKQISTLPSSLQHSQTIEQPSVARIISDSLPLLKSREEQSKPNNNNNNKNNKNKNKE